MIRHKRTRGRPAIDGLQDRRFYLDEAVVVEEVSQRLDDRGTFSKDLPDLRVDREVGVALARSQLRVLQGRVTDDGPVLQGFIFCSRKWADGLGQQLEVVDMKCYFATFGAKHFAFGLNKITDIEHPVEKLQVLLADLVQTEEELDFACAIFDMRKGDLPHRAHGTDTSGEGRFHLALFLFGSFELGDGFCAQMRPLGACRIGFDPFGT